MYLYDFFQKIIRAFKNTVHCKARSLHNRLTLSGLFPNPRHEGG